MIKKIALIIVVLFSISFIPGCIETENANVNKFVGTWKAEESTYRMYKFFDNGTCLINTYNLEGTYSYNESERLLYINQTDPYAAYVYTYFFSGDYKKLTLRNEDLGEAFIFRKQ